MLCSKLPDIRSDTAEILSTLKNFNETRHHETNPKGKEDARDYIIKSLKEYGLQVWIERPMIGNVSELSFYIYFLVCILNNLLENL